MTQKFAPGTPIWLEIGTSDVAASAHFYTALFGWTREDLGSEAGDYGLLRKDGKQVAGIGPATDPARGTSWATYFASDDVAATAAKVEANGGKIVVAPMEVMDQGSMAVCTDQFGAYFSIWQPARHTGAELLGEPGSLAWIELYTPDIAAAADFYRAVFGLTARETDAAGEPYTILSADEKEVAGVFTPPGNDDMPSYWQIYFGVEDCDASADRAIELGATEVMRTDYPGGRLALLTDPQGGIFGVLKGD